MTSATSPTNPLADEAIPTTSAVTGDVRSVRGGGVEGAVAGRSSFTRPTGESERKRANDGGRSTSVKSVTKRQVTPDDEVGTLLLESASTLLATEGPSALTVRRIANETGKSTMTVYSRFGDKQGIVEHLFLHGFELLAAAMVDVPHTADPIADLRATGQAYRRFALEHTTLYSVMFDRAVPKFEPSPEAFHRGVSTLQELADRLQRAMDMGRLRPTDALHAAAIVWSTCHGVVSLELKKSDMPIDWEAVYRDACENVIRGLAT
jgi:AcrR family transcriptional regulator